MKLWAITFAVILCFAAAANAQTKPSIIAATAEEQKEIKALQAEEKKAIENLNAAIAKLPEIEAYKKALDELNAAIAKLPESKAKEAVSEKVKLRAYRIMVNHQLSSMEYEPKTNQKGELEFHPKKPGS